MTELDADWIRTPDSRLSTITIPTTQCVLTLFGITSKRTLVKQSGFIWCFRSYGIVYGILKHHFDPIWQIKNNWKRIRHWDTSVFIQIDDIRFTTIFHLKFRNRMKKKKRNLPSLFAQIVISFVSAILWRILLALTMSDLSAKYYYYHYFGSIVHAWFILLNIFVICPSYIQIR